MNRICVNLSGTGPFDFLFRHLYYLGEWMVDVAGPYLMDKAADHFGGDNG